MYVPKSKPSIDGKTNYECVYHVEEGIPCEDDLPLDGEISTQK